MKKYIIKNADGSKQTVMQAIHESREEAGRELMRYLSYHNENWDVDDYLSPFDFKLEEVECTEEVNEIITDFENARKALGIRPNTGYTIATQFPKFIKVARLVENINTKHIDALIALNELFTIAQAWNEADGFVPDFSDWEQDKWFPWFEYHKNVAKFVCIRAGNTPTFAYASVGSRLCFKSSERAAQFGKQFADLYNKVFL